jgi:hypothetical protein
MLNNFIAFYSYIPIGLLLPLLVNLALFAAEVCSASVGYILRETGLFLQRS